MQLKALIKGLPVSDEEVHSTLSLPSATITATVNTTTTTKHCYTLITTVTSISQNDSMKNMQILTNKQ